MFKNLFHHQAEGKAKNLTVWFLVLILVLGFGAGILGEIFARSFIFSYLADAEQITELNNNFYELLAKYNFLNKEEQEGPLEIVIRKSQADSSLAATGKVEVGNFLESLQQGTVTFFTEKKVSGKDILLTAYQRSEALGRGFILTNDGWLVTSNQVLTNPKNNYVVVTAKGEVLKIDKIIADPLTPIVFTKVNINNALVLSLANKEPMAVGQMVVALDSEGGVHLSKVENNYYREVNRPADLVTSSDLLDNFYLLADSLKNISLAEPIVNDQGRVVGVVVNHKENFLVLPLQNFSSVIDQVLKTGKISRVKLGVDYLNLQRLIIDREVTDVYKNINRGALIYSNAALGVAGVAKDSAAAKAGLAVGDVILKVEGEEINQNVSLSQLVQDYKTGEEIELTVWQKGKENKVRVQLN
jgi:S1-C subfamily serine protease